MHARMHVVHVHSIHSYPDASITGTPNYRAQISHNGEN